MRNAGKGQAAADRIAAESPSGKVEVAALDLSDLDAVLEASIYPAVQNLLLAAGALGLGSALTTLAMGFAAYGLGAPAIHLAHVQTEKAWSSFALRLGLPVAGALAGGLIANAGCSSHSDRRSRAPSSAASSAPRRAASSRWWSTRRCSRASRQEVRRRRACSRSSSPPPGAGPSCLRDGSELFAGAISALAWILL